MRSAPASGAVGRALAGHSIDGNRFTVWRVRSHRCSAQGRAELQPSRLRSPRLLHRWLRATLDLVHPKEYSGPVEGDGKGGETATDSSRERACNKCAFNANRCVV